METMRNTSPLLLLLGYYLIINLILYLAMAVDKKRAVKNAWRIPEKNLYFLAVLGGGVGGLIAMYTKHHKNKHIDFILIYTITALLHLAAIYFLMKHFVLT